MGIWICATHGVCGPNACCKESSFVNMSFSREQWLEQKVSFVYGLVSNNGITKEQVRRVLEAGEGFSISGSSQTKQEGQ